MRGLPRDRGNLGTPADVPVLRSHRVLRQLATPARLRPRPQLGAPDRPLRGTGRGLELVLRRQRRVRGNQTMTEIITLPELHLADWRATKDTLHLYCQIVGKIRLATTAPRNHWWNVPLYVDIRGISTRRLHHGDTTFEITIKEEPFGVPMTTPFALDSKHGSWDREAITRLWRILDWSDSVFEEFSGWFNGKISPVHLFWHSFDLAVTRFSGRP